MYPLSPDAVYVHDSVMENDRYRRRMERVVAALQRHVEPVVFDDDDLPEMIRDHGLLARRTPMGGQDAVEDPALMFHTFRFDDTAAERAAWLKEQTGVSGQTLHALTGGGAFVWACYNQKEDPHRNDKVCRPCWRIHLQNGCVHRCAYCGFGGLLIARLNVEDYCRHLTTVMERHPWQYTFLLDDDADPPCLEPEAGCLGPLIEYFGTLEGRYLIIHTKTWNTEWMRDLKHNGNTIIVWSLSGSTQSRLLEPKTGTTEERIEAARIAEQACYQIRYKFKPIIPVKGWRDEAAEAIRLALERTHPDVISLCTFMWMDVDEMKRRLPVDELDEEFVRAAETAREQVADTRAKPFPHRLREAIYSHYLTEIRRWDKKIPVSLSTENFAMWAAFRDRLGMKPSTYVCGCGPQTVPGAPPLQDNAFRIAIRNDGGVIPGTVTPAG